MIMKNGKQINFIYKNGKRIDKIIRHGKVYFEQGFLREKTSTILPITFDGIGKDLKDYKIYGNTKQQLLPDGYTQVDYIESNGTQYINTRYYGNLNTEVQIKATNSSSNLDRQLFGDITTSSQAISCNLSLSTRLTSRFGNKSVGLTFGDYISENEIFTLIENKDGIYINNSQIATFDTTDNFSTPNSLLLLTRNSASGAGTVWNGKLYYTKIYDNNTLVRDFIPCYRNSDNEVGLYDLVNDVFYTNQGTGVFTYGDVAPVPDAPIEIVSCGDLITDSQDENYGKYKIPVNVNNVITNIYLDEPLRKIGEYNDYIDFKNGKIVRNIKEVMFDGDENWEIVNSSTSKRFQIGIGNIIKTTATNEKAAIISSHFKAISATNTWNNIVGISYRNITVGGFYIFDGIHNDINSFKTWMSENNITIDYVLSTPTEEDVELPSISTINGNNTLNIETEITPSQVYIKYKSNN